MKKPKVIAIVGATASGKTSYSIELAQKIGGEIISADSRIIYKGFDIACAKPTEDERRGIPHHMIDIVEPEVDYSAGLYAKAAEEIIYKIINKGKIPIIAGGTGLYLRLLLENYNLPQVEPDFELRRQLRLLTSEELHDRLKNLDKDAAEAIDANDKKKLIRAIEIVLKSGKKLEQSRGIAKEGKFEIEWIGKNFPRNILYERINKRIDKMLQDGMIDETKYLLKKHGRIPNLVNTIGYREIIQYLDGECSQEDSIEMLKKNSRNYAKRQLTWFRKNPNIKWDIYPEKM